MSDAGNPKKPRKHDELKMKLVDHLKNKQAKQKAKQELQQEQYEKLKAQLNGNASRPVLIVQALNPSTHITWTSTTEQLRKALFELMIWYHPDKMRGQSEEYCYFCTEVFILCNNARDDLINYVDVDDEDDDDDECKDEEPKQADSTPDEYWAEETRWLFALFWCCVC